ncbi:hypothetical protein [Pseudomonas oryzihabitans]|uniref:hypothetical protein n=1 Tax=Pseudomonas oryzihabitans TaxID=47885 RepID=UPI00214EEDFF|nr:hypothetical protein [Pseudomonas psychrotolerans]UUW72555.1 hypothetical protein NRG74_03865 [Pseudomonas psychrotolerans]
MSMQLPEHDRFDPPPLRLRRPFLTTLTAGLGVFSVLIGLAALLVGAAAWLQPPQLTPYLTTARETAQGFLAGGALLLLCGLWLRRRSQRRWRYRNALSLAPELKRRR